MTLDSDVPYCLPFPVYCLQRQHFSTFWHCIRKMEWNERQESEQTVCSWERAKVGSLSSDWVKSTAGLATMTQGDTCEKPAAALRKYRFIWLSLMEFIIISSCKHHINHLRFNTWTASSGMLMLKWKNTTRWCPKHFARSHYSKHTLFLTLHSYFLIPNSTCLKLLTHFHKQTARLRLNFKS